MPTALRQAPFRPHALQSGAGCILHIFFTPVLSSVPGV